MANVILKNVKKRYGQVEAVKEFNLEIEDKEFVVLVGPSGCGKSTTLRLIAGLEPVSEGEIYIGSKKVNNLLPKDRNLAMVFQNYALYPHKSVYSNMAFGLKMRKHPKDVIKKRIQEAAELLGLSDLLNRMPDHLSGGQRQRVALGRAIVRKPDLFLFDEPLSNLDAKLRVHMRMELIQLHNRLQKSMIYVTHDQVEAMTMGDRLVVMQDGLVQQVGTSREVFEEPNNIFVAGFIGSPSMNLIDCQLVGENASVYMVAEGIKLKLPAKMAEKCHNLLGRDMILGIRPEYIRSPARFHGEIKENLIKTVAGVIEPLGSEIIAYLDAGSNSLLAKMNADTQISSGRTFETAIDIEKVHLFEKSTGQRVI